MMVKETSGVENVDKKEPHQQNSDTKMEDHINSVGLDELSKNGLLVVRDWGERSSSQNDACCCDAEVWITFEIRATRQEMGD
jgi:hypothetical protein